MLQNASNLGDDDDDQVMKLVISEKQWIAPAKCSLLCSTRFLWTVSVLQADDCILYIMTY